MGAEGLRTVVIQKARCTVIGCSSNTPLIECLLPQASANCEHGVGGYEPGSKLVSSTNSKSSTSSSNLTGIGHLYTYSELCCKN